MNYKNNIKCAVFDLDGTLLNTIKSIHYYLNLALEKNGLGSVSEADCAAFVGDGAAWLIRRALDSLGVSDKDTFDRVFADYNAAYDADPCYLTEIYDGMSELLAELKRRGVTICVLSNKPDFVARATVSHFFGDLVTACYGSRPGMRLKPYPDVILAMLCDLGVRPDEAICIGDSDQDIATARNASLAGCISVTWGLRSEEHLISSGATDLAHSSAELIEVIRKYIC